MVNNNLFTEMLVTYNSILIITALLPNLNATAPKNPLQKLEQRCSICADTVMKILGYSFLHLIGVLQLQDIYYIKIYIINPKHIHLSPYNFQSKEGICLVLGKTFICKVSFFNTKIINCLITMCVF